MNINTQGKSHLIIDFDATLFLMHLDWEKYFDSIEPSLLRLDKTIYSRYLLYKISWGNMQNEYVRKFGKKALQLFYKNNTCAEKSLLEKVTPNDELLDFIRKNNKNYNLHIWSSNTDLIIKQTLKEYGVLHMFDKIVSRLDVSLLKPNPEGFIKRIREPETKKDSYLMIGNSMADHFAAKNADIDFHLVTTFA